jgi:AcrR family transcriptional regulator
MVFVSSPMPEPPWSSLRAKPARKALSREGIARAALAIVDAEGLANLSMRRLAQELGTGPASLYAHVSGKDELLAMLIDLVAAEMEPVEPDPARWQEQVKEYARAMRAKLAEHRDLAGAALANIPTGPNALAAMDSLLGILRAAKLPDHVIALGSDVLAQYVVGSTYEAALFEDRMAREPEYFEQLGDYFRALPADRFPNTAALADALMADDDPETRFEFGLAVLVAGLAAMA